MSSDEDLNGDIFSGPKEPQGQTAEKNQILTIIDSLNSGVAANDEEAIWPQSINIQVKKQAQTSAVNLDIEDNLNKRKRVQTGTRLRRKLLPFGI